VSDPPAWTDPASGERWRRTGACNRCGECCVGELPEYGPSVVPGMCPLFRREPGGLGTCVGHGAHPYYLKGCNVWPGKPAHTAHIAACSYSWVREGDG
jgi:hypothetical protein